MTTQFIDVMTCYECPFSTKTETFSTVLLVCGVPGSNAQVDIRMGYGPPDNCPLKDDTEFTIRLKED